jgi:hypothetical protein
MADRKSIIWNLNEGQLKEMFFDKLLLDKKAVASLCEDDEAKEDIERIYKDVFGEDFSLDKLKDIPEVEFIYAVDNYEVSKYCFPFGTDVKKNENAASVDDFMKTIDETIGWRAFFSDDLNRIMLNEHIDEIKPLYDKVIHQGAEAKDSLVQLDAALKSLQSNKSNIWEALKDVNKIEESLYLFSAISSGVFQDSVVRFTEILKTKIWFNSFDISKGLKNTTDTENDKVVSVFRDCQSGEFAFEIFEKWAKAVRKKEEKLQNSLEQVIQSIANDCHVIDRVLQINKRFAELYDQKELPKRYVLLLFSSTNYSTLLRTNDGIEKGLPEIAGQKINIFRSVSQYFLHHLAKSSKEMSKDKAKSEIDFLHKLYRIKIFSHAMYDGDVENIKKNIEKLYEDFLINNAADSYKNFEATYTRLQTEIHSFKSTLNYTSLNNFTESLTTLIGESKGKIQFLEEGIDSLQNYHIYSTAVYRAVRYEIFSEGDIDFRVKPDGDAYIRVVHHYLPLLLFFDDFKDNEALKPLVAIIKAVYGNSTKPEQKAIKDEKLMQEIQKYIKGAIIPTINDSNSKIKEYETRLILYTIFLILPNSDKDGKTYKPDYAILKEVEYDIKQLKERINESGFVNIYLNMVFIYVWSLRRIGQYDESTAEAEKVYTNTDIKAMDDPRFYHGTMLNYYCVFRKKIDDHFKNQVPSPLSVFERLDIIKTNSQSESLIQELIGYLTLSIEAAEKAISNYIIKRKKNIGQDEGGWFCPENQRPITRSTQFYAAALNSIIHIRSLQYYLTENAKDIEVCNKYLRGSHSYLKSLSHNNTNKITDYAEYQHTEALLEYCEADIFLKQKQIGAATAKIQHAEKAFLRCNTSDPAYDNYFGLEEKIKVFKVRLKGIGR